MAWKYGVGPVDANGNPLNPEVVPETPEEQTVDGLGKIIGAFVKGLSGKKKQSGSFAGQQQAPQAKKPCGGCDR